MADPISMGLMGASTLMSAGGQMAEGDAAQAAAGREAEQLKEQGDESYAAATREAKERQRKSELLISAARARSAAGGGDAADVGMTERVAEISSEGDYNALAAMFEGKMQKRNATDRANVRTWEGDRAKSASRTKALSTVISGGSKMFSGGMGST